MSRKSLLAVSLLMPLMAISSMAYAGPKITDKTYSPGEVRSQQTEADWRGAYAMEPGARLGRTAPAVNTGQSQCRYQGGPKSPMTCSR
jgi:hypothetical protein